MKTPQAFRPLLPGVCPRLLFAGCILGVVSVAPALADGDSENQIVYHTRQTEQYPRNGEGDFATLRSGRVVYYFTQFIQSAEDDTPSRIVAIDSDDRGRSWGKIRPVVGHGKIKAVTEISIVRLPSGRLAMFYLALRSFFDTRVVMRISSDEGKTWSEARPITDAPGYFILPNDRVILTGMNRLIVPVAFHRIKTLSRDTADARDYRAITLWYYSDDEGTTWHESPTWWALPVPSDSGLQEPGVVELADGSLFSWARTDHGEQWGFRSRDHGVTWSPPRPTNLQSPCSPACIKRLPHSKALLAIFNDHSGRFPFPANKQHPNSSDGPRTPLVAAISLDGGYTWPLRKLIEDDPKMAFCYTTIHFIDHAMLLAYMIYNPTEQRMDATGHIEPFTGTRVRRVSLSWLPKGW